MFLLPAHRYIGLDFSDFSLEALCLENGLYRPKVRGYSRIILPARIIQDGKIFQPRVLAECLKKLLNLARPHQFKGKLCIISLPDSQIFSTVLHFPKHLSGRILNTRVLHEIRRLFPIQTHQIYYDYKILSQGPEYQEILFAAALKSVVHDYVKVLNAAGLIPVAIDIESASLGRAILGSEDKNKVVLVADIGARHTNVSLFIDRKLAAIHFVPLAGDDITKKLAYELKISLARAEKFKGHMGAHFLTQSSGGKYINEVLRQIIFEMKKIIQQHSHKGQVQIQKIILAGGTALCPASKNIFKRILLKRVEIRNPLYRIKLPRQDYLNERSILLANVLGLALRGLNHDPRSSGINILHQTISQTQIKKQATVRMSRVKKPSRVTV